MGDGVCVVGSIAYDLSVTVARLPHAGETVVASAVRASPGGKGSNQAVAAARAGARTAMVGLVGADEYGRSLSAFLAAEGIDSSGVTVHPELPTGLAFPVVDEHGQNTVVVSLGANDGLAPGDVAHAAEVIRAASVLLLQLEVPDAALVAAATAARSADVCVVLNPAPARPLAAGLAGLLDVLVPNEHEACLLLDRDRLGDPTEAVLALRERFGVPTALITLGERGAVVGDADGVRLHPAPTVSCVDSVGAGDAFCGYLAAGLAAGLAMDAAVIRAVAAGALAVTAPGAADAVPRPAEVDALLPGGSE